MIHVDLPYNYGTFVKVVNNKNILYCGTITAYVITEDRWLAWVSGYKTPACGEYCSTEIVPMTEEEIVELKKQHGE